MFSTFHGEKWKTPSKEENAFTCESVHRQDKIVSYVPLDDHDHLI